MHVLYFKTTHLIKKTALLIRSFVVFFTAIFVTTIQFFRFCLLIHSGKKSVIVTIFVFILQMIDLWYFGF